MFEKLFKYPFEEFAKGAIRFASGLRPELALLAAAVAVLAAVYFYRRDGRSSRRAAGAEAGRVPAGQPGAGIGRRMRIVLSALRGLALALLVVILFHPVLRTPLPVTRDCFVTVLVDDSRSMRIEDEGDLPAGTKRRKSRLAAAKKLLGLPGRDLPAGEADNPGPQARVTAADGLLAELTDICPVRLFRFSVRPQRIDSSEEGTGTGERTNVYAALRVVNAELRGVPVVAVVMFTDGADNAGTDASVLEMASELGLRNIPVYTVGFGDPAPPNDYEVLRVQSPREVRRNTAVEIYASVRAAGFGDPFDVILREGRKVLESVRVVPEAPDRGSGDLGTSSQVQIHRVRLTFRPDDKGTFRDAVEVPPGSDEIILDNNRYEFLVKVTDKRLPVLYLEGSPREEYRFLRRALFRDKDFRIVSILRTEGPKKFLLQGAEEEDGLEMPPDRRSSRYAQVNGFPKTKQHLYRFEAVILGDVEAAYLTGKQRQIIEAFVRDRGGGLLMLGGVNSFNLGKYQGTEIAKMLPVVLPGPDEAYQNREFSIVLTKIGEKHPIMRQTDNVLVNRNIWSKAATLVGFNPIKQVKPGAQVLAAEPKTGSPVLVVQNYGSGRVAAFTTGGSWHWQMATPVEDELHEKFWKQLVRWLAVGSKGKITVELNKDLFARNEPVSIRTTVLDKVLDPVNDAKVLAVVTDPFDNKHRLPQEWILSEEGVYQTAYEPVDVGDYRVEVEAVMKDGEKLSQTTSFSVGETLTEFTDAGQKTELLKDLADKSGGKYLTGEQVAQITEDVEKLVLKMKRDETVYETHDIWDTPLLFGLLAVALSVEWFLRRRAGLM